MKLNFSVKKFSEKGKSNRRRRKKIELKIMSKHVLMLTSLLLGHARKKLMNEAKIASFEQTTAKKKRVKVQMRQIVDALVTHFCYVLRMCNGVLFCFSYQFNSHFDQLLAGSWNMNGTIRNIWWLLWPIFHMKIGFSLTRHRIQLNCFFQKKPDVI